MHSLTQLHPPTAFRTQASTNLYTHTQPYMKLEEWKRPFSHWLAFALPSTSRKKGGHSLWMQARMAWFVVPGRDVWVCTQYTPGSCTNLHFLFSVNISRLYVTKRRTEKVLERGREHLQLIQITGEGKSRREGKRRQQLYPSELQ
jgi:hypothetical protein